MSDIQIRISSNGNITVRSDHLPKIWDEINATLARIDERLDLYEQATQQPGNGINKGE